MPTSTRVSGRCELYIRRVRIRNISNPVHRFVASPTTDVKARISKESDELKKKVENLEKKLNYLETTLKNSNDHLNAIFKNGGR